MDLERPDIDDGSNCPLDDARFNDDKGDVTPDSAQDKSLTVNLLSKKQVDTKKGIEKVLQ